MSVAVQTTGRVVRASRYNRRSITEALRWRGPVRLSLLALRHLFRPLLTWEILYLYENDLTGPLPHVEPRGDFQVRVLSGRENLEQAKHDLAWVPTLTPEAIELRFRRGDQVAIAYAGEQVVGCNWLSFSSDWLPRIMTSTDVFLYDSFVPPAWRGRRIFTFLDAYLMRHAHENGITRALATVSALNPQSIRVQKRLGKTCLMTFLAVRTRWMDRPKRLVLRRMTEPAPVAV